MLPALAANAGYSGSERIYREVSATKNKTDLAEPLELPIQLQEKEMLIVKILGLPGMP